MESYQHHISSSSSKCLKLLCLFFLFRGIITFIAIWTWNLNGSLDSFLIFHMQSDVSHVAWICAISGFWPCLQPTCGFIIYYLVVYKLPPEWCSSSGLWDFSVSVITDYFSRISLPLLSCLLPLSSSNTELLTCLYIIWNPALPCLPVLFLFSGPSCWLEYPSLPPVA